MKNSFDPIIDWLLYKPGRIVKVVAAVVALWLVSMVAGPVLMARPPAAPAGADAAPTPTAAADETSCREAVNAWAAVLADTTTPDAQWKANLSALTTPKAQQWLPFTTRTAFPSTAPTATEVTAERGSCAAVLTYPGSVKWQLSLVPDGSGWDVDEWDDGS